MATDLEQLTDALLDAICVGDRAALEAMHVPDRTKWHNHDGLARPASIDETLLLGELLTEMKIERRRVAAIEGGFVLQFEMRGVVRRSSEPFLARSCVIAELVNGKIGNTDEYIDSAAFSALFGSPIVRSTGDSDA